jgi:hypothetical protein
VQYLVEEAYATALELYEAGKDEDRRERDQQAAAIAKSTQRRDRQQQLLAGR